MAEHIPFYVYIIIHFFAIVYSFLKNSRKNFIFVEIDIKNGMSPRLSAGDNCKFHHFSGTPGDRKRTLRPAADTIIVTDIEICAFGLRKSHICKLLLDLMSNF